MRHIPAVIAAFAVGALVIGFRAPTGGAALPVSHLGQPAWALLTFAVAAFGGRSR